MRLGLGVGEIASGAAKLEGAALVPEVLGLTGSFFFFMSARSRASGLVERILAQRGKRKRIRERKEKGENKRKVKKKRNLTPKVWKIWTPRVQVKYMNLVKKIIELSIK